MTKDTVSNIILNVASLMSYNEKTFFVNWQFGSFVQYIRNIYHNFASENCHFLQFISEVC